MHPTDRPTNQDPSTLIRPRRLAERWDKSPRTLQRWRAAGTGPAWLRIGGSIFYRIGDVCAYEEAMRKAGGPADE